MGLTSASPHIFFVLKDARFDGCGLILFGKAGPVYVTCIPALALWMLKLQLKPFHPMWLVQVTNFGFGLPPAFKETKNQYFFLLLTHPPFAWGPIVCWQCN
ncbi:hypothetical protein C8R45DRAFT_924043 [Mycena sanguinolenta]|nr:hypothetical protein C8R45DRAFT_924043 [Mycena sanguinolenta]